MSLATETRLKKQQQQINFLLSDSLFKENSWSIQVYAGTYRAASHLAVSSIRIMIIMNRTIINHGRNEGMFMLKIKQKLTTVSNGIGRGSIMYLVPKVLSEKNIDPLFNPVL